MRDGDESAITWPQCVTTQTIFERWLKINQCQTSASERRRAMYDCTVGVGCLRETVMCVNPDGSHHDVFASDGAALALVFDFLAPVTAVATSTSPTATAADSAWPPPSATAALPRDFAMRQQRQSMAGGSGALVFVGALLCMAAAAILAAYASRSCKRNRADC